MLEQEVANHLRLRLVMQKACETRDGADLPLSERIQPIKDRIDDRGCNHFDSVRCGGSLPPGQEGREPQYVGVVDLMPDRQEVELVLGLERRQCLELADSPVAGHVGLAQENYPETATPQS